MRAWLGECVCWLLVSSGPAGPLAWRKARKPNRHRGLWRGLISRKPELLLTINQHVFILPHIQSSTRPSVLTLTQTSIHPPIHSHTHSFTHPFIHPSIHPPNHSSTHSLIQLFIHPSILTSIHSPTHSFTHSFPRQFIHPPMNGWVCLCKIFARSPVHKRVSVTN